MSARIERFTLTVCGQTGDPGCLGWPDADHDGDCVRVTAEFNRCTDCGEADVYGAIAHSENCSYWLRVPSPDELPLIGLEGPEQR